MGGRSNFLVTFPLPLLVFASGETASEGGGDARWEKKEMEGEDEIALAPLLEKKVCILSVGTEGGGEEKKTYKYRQRRRREKERCF